MYENRSSEASPISPGDSRNSTRMRRVHQQSKQTGCHRLSVVWFLFDPLHLFLNMTLEQFITLHGDPARFVFKGQCFDAGSVKTNCRLCHRRIRYVYTLKDADDLTVYIGTCCFRYFEEWNPDLFVSLLAGRILLDTTGLAIQRDIKLYKTRDELKIRQRRWSTLRQQVFTTIRDYKKFTGKEWLPEPLFELKNEVEQEPRATRPNNIIKWYDQHTAVLFKKIKQINR
jgi:hypothetical protein